MKEKFTSTIAGASIFISLMGILSRGLGFIREMIFANNFGLETEFDLYLVGAVLPITINSIILYIGQNYFVPGFQNANANNTSEAQKFYKQSFILFLSIGIVVSLVLFLLSDFIIDAYMQQAPIESKTIASIVFRIFILTIPFSAAISIFSALLQAIYEFKYPAISILFLNVSVILLLVLFSEQFGVFIIPVGFLLGTILQFIYLLSKAQKIIHLNIFESFKEKINLGQFINSSIIIILIIESIGQLYSILDRYFYTKIIPGGIASLNYAYIIFILPVSIFSIAMATAVFPKISKSISDSSTTETERIYKETISINIFIFLPITFVFIYFGDSIIRIAFERGKFISESTLMTFGALKYYSISLLFYSIYAILNKIFYSLNRAKLLLLITLLGVLIKLLFNFLLVSEYQQNGLAISTSLSYLFFFLSSFILINKLLKINNWGKLLAELVVYCSCCLLSILIVNYLSNVFPLKNIIVDLFMMILFLVIYLVNLTIIDREKVEMFKSTFNNMFPKRILNH